MQNNNPGLQPRTSTASSTIFTNNFASQLKSTPAFYQQFSKSPNSQQNFDKKQFSIANDGSLRNVYKSNSTQSLIFAQNNPSPTKLNAGLGRLSSMARHVIITEDPTLEQNTKEIDCIGMGKEKQSDLPYAVDTQFTFAKNNSSSSQGSQSTKFSLENVQSSPKKPRKDSMESAFNPSNLLLKDRFHVDHLKLNKIQSSPLEKNYHEKQIDCDSTQSGSGNEVKPKNFDFLKKKKELNQPEQAKDFSPMPAYGKAIQFQLPCPYKKSQSMWPLSISPMNENISSESKCELDSSPGREQKLAGNNQKMESPGRIQLFRKRKEKSNSEYQIEVIPAFSTAGKDIPTHSGKEVQASLSKDLQSNPHHFLSFKDSPIKEMKNSRVRKQFTLQDFEMIQKLGKGAFGEVFIAQEKVIGFACVIKKMSKKKIKEQKVEEHVMREIKIQAYLNHKNLTSLYGFFHDEDNIYLILELLPDGSLQQVKKKKKLSQQETADIVKQVAVGLDFMHDELVIHRDLKPENLFLNEKFVKIGDFGCAIYNDKCILRNTIVGCLEYSSPEQLNKDSYSQKIDSWSLGILTYELLFGKSPFENDIIKIVKKEIKPDQLSELAFPVSILIHEETKLFIQQLLRQNPDDRLDMQEVLNHNFLKMFATENSKKNHGTHNLKVDPTAS